jgi:hypothetical protein
MDLLEFLIDIEEDPSIHAARLLVILKEFAGEKGDKKINGLTKLVKLDFLLRYPVYLERALVAKGLKTECVEVKDFERKSVESSMIRYHYGPWDHRYRAFINILIGKGLAEVEVEGNTIMIGITEKGIELAGNICTMPEFQDTVKRSLILRKAFEKTGAMALKEFIYSTFPEIVSLKKGEVIR